jgi:glycosyltransferase involved in cell wall biosynthesis
MKALHVTTHFNTGGISNYILTLSRALKSKGADVVVASSGGDLKAELDRFGVPHRELDIKTKFEFGPKAVRSGFRLARIIKDEDIDIIHAHTRVSQVAAAVASKIAGVPVVTTCHGYFKKRLRGVADTWGRKVVAISDAVRSHLTDDLHVRADRVALVYSGVDVSRFSTESSPEKVGRIRSELGLNSGPVIGTIGRLSAIKGQRFLIEAMKDMSAKRPDIQAILLGSGEEEESLRKLAGPMAESGSVRFYASCADTDRFLAAMDVFVFPSVKEGLGIALLEALAAGKACVASDIGGIGNIIKDGYNGLLVGVGDTAAISRAVLRLLEDDKARREMGSRGRAMVGEKFTLDSMAENILKLYEEVVCAKR